MALEGLHQPPKLGCCRSPQRTSTSWFPRRWRRTQSPEQSPQRQEIAALPFDVAARPYGSPPAHNALLEDVVQGLDHIVRAKRSRSANGGSSRCRSVPRHRRTDCPSEIFAPRRCADLARPSPGSAVPFCSRVLRARMAWLIGASAVGSSTCHVRFRVEGGVPRPEMLH